MPAFAQNSNSPKMGEEMPNPFTRHGGRLRDAACAFPHAPQPWLDLSTGVNPEPWAGERASFSDLTRLPDPADIMVLEQMAAKFFGAQPSHVMAVPGADHALRLLPIVLKATSVDVVSPTYSGHAEAWAAANANVRLIARDKMAASTSEAVVVVHPNNPDGATISADDVAGIKTRWLIVDESFCDLTPDLSVASRAGRNLVVLRSFGKFFGLPGVRLGFVIADPAIIQKMRALVGDWPVSADAVALGSAAYADTAWHIQARARLAADAQRLNTLLTSQGFSGVGGTSLFTLVARHDGPRVFQTLAAAGILIRAFDYNPSWLRFGLPPATGWARLISALESCV